MRKLRLLFVSFLSMLAWNGAFAQDVDLQAAYEAALATIQDGGTYRISTDVDDAKFYLTENGTLTANTKEAATFLVKKVAGEEYGFGFILKDANAFSNPPLVTDAEPKLNTGSISTYGGAPRDNWEAQVFFLQDGKYAVRATNARKGDSSWNLAGSVFWTVNAGENGPIAEFALDAYFVWQVEEYVDLQLEAFEKMKTWLSKVQEMTGLVTSASQWTSNAKESSEGSFEALLDGEYATFFHSQWSGTGPDEDHYLQAELPEAVEDFRIYFKKRSQNDNNRPTQINISASNDGENFVDITSITEGLPTGSTPLDFTSDKIELGDAYKYIRFTIPSTNNGAMNNGHVFFTFSEFYILPSEDEMFDNVKKYLVNDKNAINEEDIPALFALDEQIEAAYKEYRDALRAEIVFNIKDAEGNIVATTTFKEELEKTIDVVPDVLQRGYCTYAFTPVKVTEAKTYTIDATYTYAEPFPAGKDLNILVKDGHQFLTVNEDGTLGYEPYDENLELEDKYIWTITGTPYGYQIKDKLGNYISGKTKTIDNEGLEVAIASEEAATVCLVEYLWGFGIAVEDGHEIYGIDNHFRHHGHFNGSYFIAKIAGQKDVELADNRMATQGYAAQQGSIDVEAACEYLGVESLSEAKLFIVNPDGTEIADYAPFDGWFNGEGVATTWGENTKVCVKFFQVLNDGKYDICDMNGADQVGATYTVRWKLQAENGKSILYTINVNFTEYVEPVYQPEIVKTIDIAHQEIAATAYNEAEAAPTFDVAEVCEALGISSIAEAKAYIVNVTNGNFVENTTDGWRNAEGDAANWGSGEGMFCLKLNDPSTGAFDYTGAIDDTFKAGDTFVAQWGIVANEKAVLLKVTVTFVEAISQDNATAISNINLAEKAEMFDLSGRRVSKAQKGIYVINGQKVAVK
ncbi:MAG: discoidin domain-containing protein [Bacteroidaceae bacterium]|nr:discoidin domain-containing protein [Bacteroidaceae bacterium]